MYKEENKQLKRKLDITTKENADLKVKIRKMESLVNLQEELLREQCKLEAYLRAEIEDLKLDKALLEEELKGKTEEVERVTACSNNSAQHRTM